MSPKVKVSLLCSKTERRLVLFKKVMKNIKYLKYVQESIQNELLGYIASHISENVNTYKN